MGKFPFMGKEYDAQITKHEANAPVVYGRVFATASQILVAELIWRYADQDENRPKCTVPGIFWQEGAKQVGTSRDNWNIRSRKNLFAWHVRNAICEEVGLQPVQIKEQEVPNQAPKAVKKQVQQPQQTVQQAPQAQAASVQNPKIQQLLNSRVQLRGDVQQQQAAPDQKATMPKIKVWTDGSCLGNPGLGGWAAIFMINNKIMPIWGSEAKTTNNCMETMALVEALEWLDRPCEIQIFLDSEYARKIAVGENKAKKNQDLWQRYFEAAKRHKIVFEHVEAHQINPQSLEAKLNNMADETARSAAEKQLPKPTREEARAKMTEINSFKQEQSKQVEEVYPDDVDYIPEDDDYPEEG